MCGLIGVASKVYISNRNWLNAGRDMMAHRGPDDFGAWWSSDGRVGLGHRRLSIIDLSGGGHQPMHFSSESLTIVFNGEIYNFQELRTQLIHKGYCFKSNSDTEVILAAYQNWGIECLSYLRGMFAIALYDAKKQKVFLARDRAGEKPIFYHLNNNILRFSSELKGLMADRSLSRTINQDALRLYLTLGYIPGGNCILEGFNKLPPAHVLEFDLLAGTAKIRQYWCLPQINLNTSISDLDEVALLDELEGLLESSVREQLVADVPVGILLSGGVDSSLVTAMAARSSNKVQTFTIGFPGHSNHNEINHARLISKFFGTTHTELTIEQNSIDVLPLLARQFDEPVADSSMIPTFLVSQLVKSHCKVVLGGDGGDELFGGYNHYSRIVWLQKYLKWVPQHLTRTLSYLAECILPIGFRGRNWVQNMEVDLRFDVPLVGTFFNSNHIDYLLPQLHTKFGILKHGFKVREQEIGMDLIQRATRSDFRNYLVEDILVKVDRASMLN